MGDTNLQVSTSLIKSKNTFKFVEIVQLMELAYVQSYLNLAQSFISTELQDGEENQKIKQNVISSIYIRV